MATRLHAAPHQGSRLQPTLNDLPEKARKRGVDLLNQQLADLFDLHSQIKQAHWNVKGPNFIALHKLFDKAAEEVSDLMDEVAERGVQLGGIALGTARVAAEHSRLAEYPLEITSGAEHVEALSGAVGACAKSMRAAIEEAEDFGDIATSDLFTEGVRLLDKYLWMIEAHQHG